MTTFSILGILIGVVAMIILAWKGLSIYLIGPVCSLIVIFTSNMPVIDTLSKAYLPGMSGYLARFFLIFLTSSLFAKLMGDSGAARSIAKTFAGFARRHTNPKYQRFIAMCCTMTITMLLTYGGVNLFIVVWLMVTIAKPLYEELDIPWHLYMCEMWSMATVTMTMLPGNPSLVNIVPTNYLGTTTMAAPVLGIVCSLFCGILCLGYTWIQLNRAIKRGEHFLPTGAAIQARLGVGTKETEDDHPLPFILAILPSILMLISLNVFKLSPDIAMTVGCIAVVALFYKNFKNMAAFNESLAGGALQAVTVSMSVGAVVGFGAVVATVPGYAAILSALEGIGGPPIVQIVVAVEVAAGVTGSTSGGLSIALEMLSKRFLATGVNPEVIHRMACIASGGLDSLPHSAGVINALASAGLTYKQGYKHFFMVNTFIQVIVAIFGIILVMMGLTF